MTAPETHTHGPLSLEVQEDDSSVTIRWLGKSTARRPGEFVLPVLTDALGRAARGEKRLVIDFRELEYLNSSTITPMIRVLDEAKRGTDQVTVMYRSDLKWQALSFTALEVFQTDDGRVRVEGR